MTRVVTRSESETLRLGRRIAELIAPPKVVLLEGDLGAGKTVLTRGIAQGLQADPDIPVTSPTFTLVNEYPLATGTMYHVDLYRLHTLRDLYSIGIEDILASESIVVVEWGEKLTLKVADPLRIRILAGDDPEDRIFEIEPDLDLGA